MTYDETYDDLLGQPRTSRRDRRTRRRKKKSRFGSFLAVVLSLAVIGGGLYAAYTFGRDWLGDRFAPAADYDGPGHGEVAVNIPDGAGIRSMGTILEDAGVVASADAFVDAAGTQIIQAGDYTLQLEMKAEDAVSALVEGTTVLARVTIPEGFRIGQIVERIVEETEFGEEEIEAVLAESGELGLPDFAGEITEGFLFPATYDIMPDTTGESLIGSMVNRFNQAAEAVDLVAGAEAVGLEPLEAVTVASIIQREVRREEDMPDVAQVIYNRMAGDCSSQGVPEGLLQMDSTVHYAAGDSDSAFTSDEERDIDSPYNTYQNAGIPPGPIAAPGEAALSAALTPSEGSYCYFVAVNLETGETKFAETEAEHNANRGELDDYCRENDC